MAPFLGWLRGRMAPYQAPDWHYTTQSDLQDDLRDRLNGENTVTRWVSPKTKGYLDQAERAIQEARRATPDGAGNQWTDVINSNGRAYARVSETRKLPIGTTKERAQAAHIAGGAHCDEFGAMTFAALVAEGVKGKPVIKGRTQGIKHVYTVIGDPRESNDVIAVDAWVTRPQALTWDDFSFNTGGSNFRAMHAWNDSRPNPEYDFSDIVAKPFSQAQANAKYGMSPGEDLVDWIRSGRGRRNLMWEETFASDTDGWINYQAG